MRKAFAKNFVAAAAALVLAAPAFAGGVLENIDTTGNVPSPVPGQVVGRLVGNHWDVRSLPVSYVLNNTSDPIPNALGAPFVPLAAAKTVFDRCLDSWNAIPTSYMESHIVGTVANPGTRGFDLKSEITFRTTAGFTAIASSVSTVFTTDATLNNGDDLDGDGDSDVSNAITNATDVDHDGDVEMVAGFYKAGTILENDVQFNTKASNGYRFTVTDAALDTNTRSVDLEAVAVHELGHSIGLSHVQNNQDSATDGSGATMFPFIDTGDPDAEKAQRDLNTDDIAWASYLYPEGSAASGLPALQAGDVRFDSVYGLIRGSVTHGVLNQPIAGAAVVAVDRNTGREYASAFSGTTQLSVRLSPPGSFLVNPAFNIINGNFVIPVAKGNYDVYVEPVDGQPVPATSISTTTQIGSLFGQMGFNEEYWNGNNEGALEKRSGESKNVHVNQGEVQTGIDIVTNAETNISNFGTRDFVGFTLSPAGRYYAVRIPGSQIAAFNPGGDLLIHAAAFNTVVTDNSTIPAFAEAILTTGSVSGTTPTINLASPLEKVTGFIGQDNDFAPFYFKNPQELGHKVRLEMGKGTIQDLFLVLRVPLTTPFPGISGVSPLVGLDGGQTPPAVNDVPIFGNSYTSDDGGATWTLTTRFNFMFSLILSQ